MTLKTLQANWPAPPNIGALTTLKQGGLTDDLLTQSLSLPAKPYRLTQVHSNHCVQADEHSTDKIEADASITSNPNIPLVVVTADCLPILVCNKQGTEIAAIHAGWRGLAAGILDNTLSQMKSDAADCLAWIGPGICDSCFEVGEEVVDTFLKQYPFSATAFSKKDITTADLPLIAQQVFNNLGLQAVFHSNKCTYESPNDCYSYRRTPQTGRMNSIIWFKHRI